MISWFFPVQIVFTTGFDKTPQNNNNSIWVQITYLKRFIPIRYHIKSSHRNICQIRICKSMQHPWDITWWNRWVINLFYDLQELLFAKQSYISYLFKILNYMISVNALTHDIRHSHQKWYSNIIPIGYDIRLTVPMWVVKTSHQNLICAASCQYSSLNALLIRSNVAPAQCYYASVYTFYFRVFCFTLDRGVLFSYCPINLLWNRNQFGTHSPLNSNAFL